MNKSLPRIRQKYGANAAKLRRARRLYFKIIMPYVIKYPESIEYFSYKAIDRGLYVDTSYIYNIIFSMLRHFYKNKEGVDGLGTPDDEWFDWLRSSPWGNGFWHERRFRYIYKPRRKISINMRKAA